MKSILRVLSFVLLIPCLAAAAERTGVPVAYELPAVDDQSRTYLVTLAIVEARNPDRIVSQFSAGIVRTVTKENAGKFAETWDGLDDNFMPAPPGDYAVKGIYAEAKQWAVDGEWHSITPRFAGGAGPWLPSPEDWQKGQPFGGDPVGQPMKDIAVGPNGIAAFYYEYLENGTNLPVVDLNKPIGPGQFIRAFNSGGAGGGTSVTTDGHDIWAFSTDGGPKFVYRADGKSFGVSHGANRNNAYLPPGWVTAMAAWRDPKSSSAYVYVAQRGKIDDLPGDRGHRRYRESATDFVNKLTIHRGENGQIVAEILLERVSAMTVAGDVLYVMQQVGDHYAVSKATIAAGIPGVWEKVLTVPANINPADMEVDSRGRFYVSDPAANKVYQLDSAGKVLLKYGNLPAQKPGAYDPNTFMLPEKLATWRDAEGNDRLLVVEQGGPNRVSEWSADGKLLREFMSIQTHANDGYAFDPDRPNLVYLPGKKGWMTRFKVDYATREWKVDAVWPFVDDDPLAGRLNRIQLIRTQGRTYLAGRRSYTVYRFDGDRLVLSAGVIRLPAEQGKPASVALWNDADGNGQIDKAELRPTTLPGRVLIYHGQNWTENLTLLAPAQGSRDLWKLSPSGFDAHGNPIFTEFTRILTDPHFAARAAGHADALGGGNEMSDNFPSDWMGADGNPDLGYYIQARGGPNFSANEGSQHKISRYVPDGKGGYVMKWRTGRTALATLARPGEMYGGMRIQRPINGLLSVIDQSRCGILLYTDEGLYVDTIFPDGRRASSKSAGIYPQPGEFFAGQLFANRQNGRIYAAMGKYTPLLYKIEGWSLREDPVRPIAKIQPSVHITASQTASPPEIALTLRGGSGAAKVARFAPGLGEPAMDGSIAGWESCDPIQFKAEANQTVEVRCLFQPDRLLLRWHTRLGSTFVPKPLPPLERVFTHDQKSDTVSFYVQSDPAAKPRGNAAGRPGDARFVFGIFKDTAGQLRPVAVGMHAEWQGTNASPQVYRTPVGEAKFAHVGAVQGAQLGHSIDPDGKGFVIVASIPRTTLPRFVQPFAGGFRTLGNFEATFGGHSKTWWANTDGSASRETYDEPTEARLYPGSWAPMEFTGLGDGVVVRNWQIIGPFGGPGTEKFKRDPNGKVAGTTIDMKKAVQDFFEKTQFPPDDPRLDLAATFSGDLVRGYWRDPGTVKWKPASIELLDTRVAAGDGGQAWFGVTWVYSPVAQEIDADLQSNVQTVVRWTVNGQSIAVKPNEYVKGTVLHSTQATKKVALKAGWNEVRFRAYCFGYPPIRVGMVLKGDESVLWPMKLSAVPPADQR